MMLLIEKAPDDLRIESEISEPDATEILQTQGAFEPDAFELDGETAALLSERLRKVDQHPEEYISSEEMLASLQDHIQEQKRTIWQQAFGDCEKALQALRWSGFQGPVFEAYWNDPLAWISFSAGNSRQFMSSGMQAGGFVNAADPARKILGAAAFDSAVGIMHPEEPRVRVEQLLPRVDATGAS
jgi:hypothetical protein